ncbi:MAG: type II toxin-antitoxin system VapB family antitoxin [Micrococcales bacterium]|nr:type II toxin-antitoxin system VapB family antitoxin [Micrococcales bacterium]
MSLNIKNPRTCASVRRLAETTGLSQTSAVEQAVERWLEELERETTRYQEHQALLERYWANLTDESRDAMQRAMDEMYDENGLPA